MEQSLSVPVGQVITLNVGLSSGSTIYNMDGKNSIWVSANPGVFSGIGMKIGPRGTLTWAGNSACYAIADAVATDSVPITISDNASGMTNPVDVGVAVALGVADQALSLTDDTQAGIANKVGIAVSNQSLNIGSITGGNVSVVNTSVIGNDVAVAVNTAGVPNIPRTAALLNTSAFTNLGGGVFQVKYNTNLLNWASLIVTLAFTGPGAFYYEFYDSVTDPTLTSAIASHTYQQAVGSPVPVQFSTPVLGNTILITIVLSGLSSASGIKTRIVGTNQLLTTETLSNDPMYNEARTQAFMAGGIVTAGAAYNSPGGLHSLHMYSSGTTNDFALLYNSYSIINQIYRAYTVANTVGGGLNPAGTYKEVFAQTALPAGVIYFGVQTKNAGTYTVGYDVIPNRT